MSYIGVRSLLFYVDTNLGTTIRCSDTTITIPSQIVVSMRVDSVTKSVCWMVFGQISFELIVFQSLLYNDNVNSEINSYVFTTSQYNNINVIDN